MHAVARWAGEAGGGASCGRSAATPALPLAAEAGEAAVALQAVALQEALHRAEPEHEALGCQR
ncbi:MAG: hypothetical protein F4Y03_06920, partial [Alphaproteobacteria bacterium]|nr:hypothetical protein [Alphaproteobacteria bacterium]